MLAREENRSAAIVDLKFGAHTVDGMFLIGVLLCVSKVSRDLGVFDLHCTQYAEEADREACGATSTLCHH